MFLATLKISKWLCQILLSWFRLRKHCWFQNSSLFLISITFNSGCTFITRKQLSIIRVSRSVYKRMRYWWALVAWIAACLRKWSLCEFHSLTFSLFCKYTEVLWIPALRIVGHLSSGVWQGRYYNGPARCRVT